MAIQNRLVPLHDALFSETSPGAGEVRRKPVGQDFGEVPAAAGADHGEHAGEGARGDDRCGVAELTHWYPYRLAGLVPAIHVS